MHQHILDSIDLKILEIIQCNARIKRKDLAVEVHLTIPAVSERMRKMEEEGYVLRYSTVLNPKMVGLGVSAFIFVDVESSKFYDDIINQANKYEEISECHAITGNGSHILKIKTSDVDHLEKILVDIQSWKGVKSTKTSWLLSSPKETTEVSLSHLKIKPIKSQ